MYDYDNPRYRAKMLRIWKQRGLLLLILAIGLWLFGVVFPADTYERWRRAAHEWFAVDGHR